jgi:hypothetical protein
MKRLLVFLGLLFISCETEIRHLNISSDSDAIVVYGELTNYDDPLKVRIHYASRYDPYDITTFKGKSVEDARVFVTDNEGNITSLNYLGDGLYSTIENFIGKENSSYKLQIITKDGLEIESEESLLKASPEMINFSSEFKDAEKVEDMSYELSAKIKDKKGSADQYFIRRQDFIEFLTTCQDPPPPPASPPPCYIKCWKAPQNTQPILLKDFLIDGAEIPIPLSSIDLKEITNWVIQIEALSVSKTIYDYWETQERQRLIGGSIFDKIPAQIAGNLKCTNQPEQQVLGVFVVAGITKQRLEINRFERVSPEVYQKIQTYVDFNDLRFTNLKLNDCRRAAWIDYNLGFTIPSL